MTLRREALLRYGANETSVLRGPRPHLTFPNVGIGAGSAKKRIGPLRFNDRLPLLPFVDAAIDGLRRPSGLAILEIGPGRGELAAAILARHGPKIATYAGLDRDPTVRGAYARIDDLTSASDAIDLVIASEVIEHMSADDWYAVLSTLAPRLATGAALVVSTPNPLAPGGIARDFTHRQHYPWYDLYAILRLFFEAVDVRRSLYLFDAKRLVQLVPRIALCSLLELEWCDGLIAVARRPRSSASEPHP